MICAWLVLLFVFIITLTPKLWKKFEETVLIIYSFLLSFTEHQQTNGGVVTNGGTVTATTLTGLNGSTAMIARECANCGKRITERFLLKALDLFWHEDCLKCGCCDCRLGEVGSTLYTKANLILCKRDYLR